MEDNQIITINSGSSSIKFAAFQSASLKKTFSGHVTNIGIAPVLEFFDATQQCIQKKIFTKHTQYSDFFEILISEFTANKYNFEISAVGHRVVHGGAKYHDPICITPEVIRYLQTLISFAPLHQPYNLQAIECIQQQFPDLKQVACFDTAFHQHHQVEADRFALPRDLLDAGIKRYGFHGLSYEYVMQIFKDINPNLATKRIIVAHLGNGASMCAIHNGKSISSTMGFTALDGLMMGTRCGSLDPGVILYLMQSKNMTAAQIETMLYKQSGLLGVSGISSDMQILLENKSTSAREAIDLFVYRIRHELGALVAALGGLDALVFTAGIGEHAWQIRERVCMGFEWLGILVNSDSNKQNNLIISDAASRVSIYVIPTDEELMIAQHTHRVLTQDDNHGQ